MYPDVIVWTIWCIAFASIPILPVSFDLRHVCWRMYLGLRQSCQRSKIIWPKSCQSMTYTSQSCPRNSAESSQCDIEDLLFVSCKHHGPLVQAAIRCELGQGALLFPACAQRVFDRGAGSYCFQNFDRFAQQVWPLRAMVGCPGVCIS